MKKTAIQKIPGKRIKLRPIAVRRNASGKTLKAIDDIWLVNSASEKEIEIQNLRTGHFYTIPRDGMHDFRFSSAVTSQKDDCYGIIKLLGFIWISGDHAGFEPLSLPTAEALFLRQIGL